MGVAVYTCLSVLAFIFVRRALKKPQLPLPPGPKPLPIIGNLLQFPQKEQSATFAEWKKQYGDIIYLNILGKPIVILNSRKACNELLEKRSAIYSDRPRMVMVNELMEWNEWGFAAMPYSANWRQHRRVFHQHFNENASQRHRGIQERSTHKLLIQLLHTPEELFEHMHLFFASTIPEILYGIQVKDTNDAFVQLAEKAMRMSIEGAQPGKFLVEVLPILKYIPSWLPGAGFQKFAAEGRLVSQDLIELPARYVEQNMETSSARSSVLSLMHDQCEGSGGSAESIRAAYKVAKNAAAVAYVAGADTTISSMQALFMTLANHPEAQKAAQAELDTVIGSGRLPTFDDKPNLPHVHAIMKEVFRWHAVAPMGIPHNLIVDDVYEGFMIPKGTMVLPNISLVLRDPEIYPNPDVFDYSRWLMDTPEGIKLNNAIPDPEAAFGFGRRVCPGRHVAENALFIIISNVLACFDISPLDDAGKPAKQVPENFTDGFVVFPAPFKVSIKPRSDEALRLLKVIDM